MEPVRLSTEDGVSLEGEIRMPEGAPRGSAVICHAHPRHGGSKDHPILWAIRNELAHRGFAVLGFNFRGVMRSSGTYGSGLTEVADVRAAVGRIGEEAGGPTIACGWSFGANVALREALTDDRVAALALVGIPLSESSLDLPPLPGRGELGRLRRPVLLLAGEGDTFCPTPELRALGAQLTDVEVVILPGTDHFLWRRENEAAERIGEFAEHVLS
ncbi:MAG: alpha/beta hydrolase [Actinomycetota bacterium]